MVTPVLENLVKMGAAAPPAANSTPEEQQQWQQNALAASLQTLKQLNYAQLEQVLYVNFGCKTELREFRADPIACFEHLKHVVPLSLTEQRERLLDLADEVVGTMVEHSCPASKHAEDWDFDGLNKAYHEMFGIEATGVEKIIGGQHEIAQKLYTDAEGVIKRREHEVGELIYLRVLRNFYLQEIDNQWLEHLQNMESLRDGIGLRGYGQRDPKKEYQKEGFDLFLELMQNIKASVVQKMFHFVIDRPDEVERLEAERRRRVAERQQKMQASHAAAAAATSEQEGEGEGEEGEGQAAPAAASRRARRRMAAMGQQVEAPAPKPQTIKRDKPKLGRNDPCWCNSGKKYKNCHLRSDEAAERTARAAQHCRDKSSSSLGESGSRARERSAGIRRRRLRADAHTGTVAGAAVLTRRARGRRRPRRANRRLALTGRAGGEDRVDLGLRERVVVQRDLVEDALEGIRRRAADLLAELCAERAQRGVEAAPVAVVATRADRHGDRIAIEVDGRHRSVERDRDVMERRRADEAGSDAVRVADDRGGRAVQVRPGDQLVGERAGAAVTDLQ
jgi:hypothetical protein